MKYPILVGLIFLTAAVCTDTMQQSNPKQKLNLPSDSSQNKSPKGSPRDLSPGKNPSPIIQVPIRKTSQPRPGDPLTGKEKAELIRARQNLK